MQIKVLSEDDGLLRLEAEGRIVQGDRMLESDALDQMLGDQGYARSVLLSLGGTEFIDSSGLSWLVVRHKRFCEAGGTLVLHSIPPTVLELLKMMRLDLVLHLAEDETAAMELIRGENR